VVSACRTKRVAMMQTAPLSSGWSATALTRHHSPSWQTISIMYLLMVMTIPCSTPRPPLPPPPSYNHASRPGAVCLPQDK
jgi:hypothetical protein